MNLIDLTGKRFGRLLVVERSPIKSLHPKWLCLCDCGVTRIVGGSLLVSEKTKSCGCLRKEIVSSLKLKHGASVSRAWNTWCKMKSRCYNVKDKKFKNYGARGIAVCERWFDFSRFLADMGQPPIGMTLDREDVNGNYEPSNCRWADAKTQAGNKTNTIYLTLDGVTKKLIEWAGETGINKNTLYRRVNDGWDDRKVLTYGRF